MLGNIVESAFGLPYDALTPITQMLWIAEITVIGPYLGVTKILPMDDKRVTAAKNISVRRSSFQTVIDRYAGIVQSYLDNSLHDAPISKEEREAELQRIKAHAAQSQKTM